MNEQQQNTPQFTGSISGESIQTITVAGNTIEEVIAELQSAPRSPKNANITQAG